MRDACKMLVMNRETGELEDRIFRDIIDYLEPGDVLVANETRVLPARLWAPSAARAARPKCSCCASAWVAADAVATEGPDGALGGENQQAIWEVLVRPGKRLKPGSGAIVDFTDAEGNVALSAGLSTGPRALGPRRARIAPDHHVSLSLDEALHAVGPPPLPPTSSTTRATRSSTKRCTRARKLGGSTHCRPAFYARLIELRAKGVEWHTVELEVGLDTPSASSMRMTPNTIHTGSTRFPQETVDARATPPTRAATA